MGRSVLSGWCKELDGEGRYEPQGRNATRRKILCRVRRVARPPGAAGRGRRFVGLLLLFGYAMTLAGLTSTTLWMMLLLGAFHGINPGMGWLFASELGL